MSDSRKTKKELIEELKALRSKAEVSGAGDQTHAGDTDDGSPSGVTRRDVLSAWVAPVILTVPLVPRDVVAQTVRGVPTVEPTQTPTQLEPTQSPTQPLQTANPTGGPTAIPTQSPTGIPTAMPTQSPTGAPTGSPTGVPTAVPTQSPTAFPTVSPTTVIPVELSEFEIE
jgi:hypothetical protein